MTIALVERFLQTLKTRLSVIEKDPKNTGYKFVSDAAELTKTKKVTPHDVTMFFAARDSQG